MRLRISNVTPNWFASVMGTGIVANAAATQPYQFPGLRAAAIVVWLLACALLIFFVAATVLHWLRHPRAARGHHSNPVMAHFYGAPPMAFLTVGAGTLLLGKDLIGLHAAIRIDAVLWTIGTVGGLFSAVAVPYLAFTRHQNTADSAFGGWLMPVVPPMVSAATGALLLPYTAAGQERATLPAMVAGTEVDLRIIRCAGLAHGLGRGVDAGARGGEARMLRRGEPQAGIEGERRGIGAGRGGGERGEGGGQDAFHDGAGTEFRRGSCGSG